MRILFSIIMGLLLLGPLNQAAALDLSNIFPPSTPSADLFSAPTRWIEPAVNMRDGGGWTIPGKGAVPYDILYRSRELYNLRDSDKPVIQALGIKTLVDFRAEEERHESPDDPDILSAVDRVIHLEVDYNKLDTEYEVMRYLHCTPDLLTNPAYRTPDPAPTQEQLDYALMYNFIEGKVESGYVESFSAVARKLTPEFVAANYTDTDGRYIYVLRVYIDEFNQFLNLVKDLEDSQAPLLFHCSEGKDRTGIANALVLRLLNVPDGDILEDFLDSNDAASSVVGFPIEVVQKANMVALLKWIPANLELFDFRISDFARLTERLAPVGGLVPRGGDWRYNDFGSQVNTNAAFADFTGTLDGEWVARDFEDVQWREGTAPFGYSAYSYNPLTPEAPDTGGRACSVSSTKYPDNPLEKGRANANDIKTVTACTDTVCSDTTSIGCPCDIQEEVDTDKIPTYFFRHTFELEGGLPQALVLQGYVDDGAVVYLNGEEVARINMPEGYTDEDLHAYTAKGSFMEGFEPLYLNSDALREGKNVLAVEVHQVSRGSQDLYFDMELLRAGGTLVKGSVTGPDGLPVSLAEMIIEDLTPHRVSYKAPDTADGADSSGGPVYKQYRVTTNMNGNFTRTLAAGTYRISSDDERYPSAAATSFTVEPGDASQSVSHAIQWPISTTVPLKKGENWSYWPSTWETAVVEEIPDGWNLRTFNDDTWAVTNGAVSFAVDAPDTPGKLFSPAFTVYNSDDVIINEAGVPMRMLFRRTFTAAHPESVTRIAVDHVIDDGAVFYLNGVEVGRFNMPEGALDENSMAAAVTNATLNTLVLEGEALDALVRGENLLGVAVYGFSSTVPVSVEGQEPRDEALFSLLFNGCTQDPENPSNYNDCEIPGDGLGSIARFELGIGDTAREFLEASGKTMELLGRKIANSSDVDFDLGITMTTRSVQVAGKVIDASGNPLSDVTVEIKNTDVKGVTDDDGSFNLYAPAGEVVLLVHIPDDPDLRVLSHDLVVPAGGVGDLSLTLLGSNELPSYELSRMPEPQVIAAGISPSIVDASASETLVSLLAIVRPGELPVLGVEMQSKEGGSFMMQKSGELGNGDEIWTFQAFLPRGTTLKFLSEDVITGITARDGQRVSPAFPLYSLSNRKNIDGPENERTLAYSSLDRTVAKRPQLIACGQSPSVVSMDNHSAQILAVVRPGENGLERVTLKKGDCFGCTTLMSVAGRLPNGDYIYAGSMDGIAPGYHNEERDILQQGWAVTATDTQGGESNACFHIEWPVD